jgi:hypothetical protein
VKERCNGGHAQRLPEERRAWTGVHKTMRTQKHTKMRRKLPKPTPYARPQVCTKEALERQLKWQRWAAPPPKRPLHHTHDTLRKPSRAAQSVSNASPRSQPLGVAVGPLQQQRQPRLRQQRLAVRAARAVHAQSHVHARVQHGAARKIRAACEGEARVVSAGTAGDEGTPGHFTQARQGGNHGEGTRHQQY